MVIKPVRSGWLIAVLTLFSCIALLGQTDPYFNLTWDILPNTGVKFYRIQTAVGSLPFATVLECPAPPCKISGINPTTLYKIQVAGVSDSNVEGYYSVPITFIFAGAQPVSPSSLSQLPIASTDLNKIANKLSWPAVKTYRSGVAFPASTAVAYQVYQAGTGQCVLVANTTVPTYTVQLPKNKSFMFYVTCVADGVESFSSPPVRVNTN